VGQTEATGTATGGSDTSTNRKRGQSTATNASTGTETSGTYSVREDVGESTSSRSLLPSGEELTLLGIFFALYPVLVFSALFPPFPLFVKLILGACTLLTIAYLQSLPTVSVPLFGGWSALGVIGMLLFSIGFLSPVGLMILAATVLPFGLSVLTSSALRH